MPLPLAEEAPVYLAPEERRAVLRALRESSAVQAELVERVSTMMDGGVASHIRGYHAGIAAGRQDQFVQFMGRLEPLLEEHVRASAAKAEADLLRQQRWSDLLGPRGLVTLTVGGLVAALTAAISSYVTWLTGQGGAP